MGALALGQSANVRATEAESTATETAAGGERSHGLSEDLHAGTDTWEPVYDGERQLYYHNVRTHETSWELPDGAGT